MDSRQNAREHQGDSAGRTLADFETAPFDRFGTSPRAIRTGRERAIAPNFGLRG